MVTNHQMRGLMYRRPRVTMRIFSVAFRPPQPHHSHRLPIRGPAASSGGRVVASGFAKKEAGVMGIDLSALAGTGPGGRVVARDVAEAPKGGAGAAPASAPAKPSWTPAPGVVAATPT